ncbi:hypothetical protein JHK87_000460 [Glycine soja]|nr:hypothetical protein JHK87_000460 [Glycine soja]
MHSSLQAYSEQDSPPSLGNGSRSNSRKSTGNVDDVRSNGWLDAMKASSPPRKKLIKGLSAQVMVPTIGVSPNNFAHAIKPLDVETCNGPERGISPCDAFFIREAFSGSTWFYWYFSGVANKNQLSRFDVWTKDVINYLQTLLDEFLSKNALHFASNGGERSPQMPYTGSLQNKNDPLLSVSDGEGPSLHFRWWKMVTILGLVPAQAILYPQLCEFFILYYKFGCRLIFLTSLSALVAETTTFPIHLIKTRLQLHGDSLLLSHPTSAFRVGLGIIREQGALGLYSDLSPTIFRHMFYTLIQNVVSVDNASISIVGKVVVGGIFGVVAQAVVDEWTSSLFWVCYRVCVFARNLYGSIPDVVVPLMYTEYTTRKVLVMEWIEVRAYALVIPELIDLKDDLQKHFLIGSACPLNINNALLMECPSAPATSIGGIGSSVIMILLYLMSMEKLL